MARQVPMASPHALPHRYVVTFGSAGQVRVDGTSFSTSNFAGSVGAPTGEHAAVGYQASLHGVPVDGSLLLRRRP